MRTEKIDDMLSALEFDDIPDLTGGQNIYVWQGKPKFLSGSI